MHTHIHTQHLYTHTNTYIHYIYIYIYTIYDMYDNFTLYTIIIIQYINKGINYIQSARDIFSLKHEAQGCIVPEGQML